MSFLPSLDPPLPIRPVTAVRRCSQRRKGNTTVDHAARVSAIPAPATGCLCQREAGAAVLSGCVRPATDREGQLTPTARVRHLQPISGCIRNDHKCVQLIYKQSYSHCSECLKGQRTPKSKLNIFLLPLELFTHQDCFVVIAKFGDVCLLSKMKKLG